MRIFILLFSLSSLYSCASKSKSNKENIDFKKSFVDLENFNSEKIKFKLNSSWYSNEKEIHLVYGTKENDIDKDYITELHFNFGGRPDCEFKSLIAKFDFKNSQELQLIDSLNKLDVSIKKIVEREKGKSNIEYNFKNPNPGVLLFSIERVNLKPNTKKYIIDFSIESKCAKYLKLPIVMRKYSSSKMEELINNYIKTELNLFSEKKLKHLKVIFSFNEIKRTKEYFIDIVNQREMQTLTYESKGKEFIIKNSNDKIIRRIDFKFESIN